MASPQLEDGYTRIANELYRALYMADLSGAELRIVHFVLYNTYGYNKKTCQLSADFISKGTNIPVKTVRRCLNSLVTSKVLISNGSKTSIKSFGINKNYEKWVLKNGYKIPKIEGTQKWVGVLKNGDTQKRVGVLKNEQGGTHKRAKGYSKMSLGVLKNEYQYKTDNTRQNKTIQSSSSTTATASPKIEEVLEYCKIKNYTFDGKKFFYHYQSLGWRYKGQPITDWKALADKWQETERHSSAFGGGDENSVSYDINEFEKYSMFDGSGNDEVKQ
ncbi:MAG: replication protein [Ruminococcus sp.]